MTARSLPRVVPDLALEQLSVCEDDLLAGFAAHARGLESDVLDLAAIILHRDRVADDERLVQHDRDRGEKIGERVLHGERNGQSADAKSGEQRLDLDLERGQCGEAEHDPDRESGDRAQRLERRDAAPVGRVKPNVPLEVVPDDDVGPYHALHEEREDGGDVGCVLAAVIETQQPRHEGGDQRENKKQRPAQDLYGQTVFHAAEWLHHTYRLARGWNCNSQFCADSIWKRAAYAPSILKRAAQSAKHGASQLFIDCRPLL